MMSGVEAEASKPLPWLRTSVGLTFPARAVK
jgi:hypothetical protein